MLHRLPMTGGEETASPSPSRNSTGPSRRMPGQVKHGRCHGIGAGSTSSAGGQTFRFGERRFVPHSRSHPMPQHPSLHVPSVYRNGRDHVHSVYLRAYRRNLDELWHSSDRGVCRALQRCPDLGVYLRYGCSHGWTSEPHGDLFGDIGWALPRVTRLVGEQKYPVKTLKRIPYRDALPLLPDSRRSTCRRHPPGGIRERARHPVKPPLQSHQCTPSVLPQVLTPPPESKAAAAFTTPQQ